MRVHHAAALRKSLHLGVEHAAGGTLVAHEGEGDAVFGIHARVEGVGLDGVVESLPIGGGEAMETAIGGCGLIAEHLDPRNTDVFAGTRKNEK